MKSLEKRGSHNLAGEIGKSLVKDSTLRKA